MNFLLDLAQEGRIREAERPANQAVDKTIDATSTVDGLKRRIDAMALANQALFEVLQKRLGIPEEEVIRRMAEIDSRDGLKDGKMGANVVRCRQCSKPVSTTRQRCMFCGEIVVEGHLFEKA
jgi:hypothetical protein